MAFLRRARAPIAAVLVLLAALAAWWYFSPYLAMRELQNAAQERDVQTIEQRVDFPRLRESLKAQLGAAMTGSLRSTPDNPFSGLAASVGGAMVSGVVELLVRPEMLMYSLRYGLAQGTPRAEPPSAPAPPPAPPADRSVGAAPQEPAPPRWRMEWRDADRVVFRPVEDGARKSVGMVFERQGFATWMLVGMELPSASPGRP